MIQKTVRMCLGQVPLGGLVSAARVGPEWVSGECCRHGTSTGIGCRSTGHKLLPLASREPGHFSSGGLLWSAVIFDAGFRSGIVC